MPVPKTSGTLEEFAYALIEQLEREEPVLRERHRRLFREAFEKMARAKPARSYEQIKADYRARKRIDVEPRTVPEPPPLPPGKARVVSF